LQRVELIGKDPMAPLYMGQWGAPVVSTSDVLKVTRALCAKNSYKLKKVTKSEGQKINLKL